MAVAALGLMLAPNSKRPDLLIGREGKLHAVRTQEGVLAANSSRRNYSLEQWLLSDGDARRPTEAGRADIYRRDDLAGLATVDGKTIALVRHPAAFKEECVHADIAVTSLAFEGPCPKARLVVDRIDVGGRGACALSARSVNPHRNRAGPAVPGYRYAAGARVTHPQVLPLPAMRTKAMNA